MATIQDVKRIAKQLSKKAAASKQDVLTLDTEPQANSARPLTSGAVHSSIAALTSSLDGKQNVINPGGLVTDRAVVFNANGDLAAVLGVSAAEVGHLSQVTSDIQSQLNSKQAILFLATVSTNDSQGERQC